MSTRDPKNDQNGPVVRFEARKRDSGWQVNSQAEGGVDLDDWISAMASVLVTFEANVRDLEQRTGRLGIMQEILHRATISRTPGARKVLHERLVWRERETDDGRDEQG